MRLLLASFIFTTYLHAQNCSLEALETEKRNSIQGDYKGQALINKLDNLLKELKILSSTNYEQAQKSAMKFCLKSKDTLFQKLMGRNEANVQESAAFQEILAEFYKLHNDPRMALIRIDRAVQLNPKSLSLLLKSSDMFAEAENIELRELSGKPIAIPESQRVIMEFAKRSARITEHPEVTRAQMLKHLEIQAWVYKILKNYPQEMIFWERIVGLDPKNQKALQNRFDYFVSKKLISESAETMKRLSRENLATESNWNRFLTMLSDSEQWEEFSSWTKKAPVKIVEGNSEIQVRLARANLELGRKDEAFKIMKTLPRKLSSTAATYAAQNDSRIKELTADQYKSEGRLSEALDEYKKAMKFSPRPLTLREKISLLIYEYRQGLGFKPPEATQKDLGEVVQLLEKSVYETELKSNLFGVYLHSLKLINNRPELTKGCARYKVVYPELVKSKDYLSYCQ